MPEPKKVAVWLEPDDYEVLTASAARNTRTLSQEIRHLIRANLKRRIDSVKP